MKILITGGAGFIGSHLSQRLLNEGNEVLCLDNFFTGQERNLVGLAASQKFHLVRHDIVETIPFYQVDRIYNLACPASPIHYQENPIKTIKTSTIGMINVLGLARKAGARVLQASTSEVYGDPEVHPQKEEYLGNVNPIGPRSCYDEGKRVAESLCVNYQRAHGMEVRIARIFNTYGPNMHPNDGRVVSNFIVQALEGEPITIYGDGSQTRSFCYVSDLVDGLIKLMESDVVGPVNLGNPNEITVRELAEEIIQLAGSSSKVETHPMPEDDPRKRKPDITKAKTLLHWEPTISREEGLQKTIRYFRSRID
jgi:UDP-glucuronate decarboxylase